MKEWRDWESKLQSRNRNMLKFNENGKFGILIFGDIHEKKDYADNLRFADMHKMMNAALDEFRPDLCVLLGDNFSTGLLKENPEAFKKGLADLCEPIMRRNIPVAAVMGNHEHDINMDKELLEAYAEAGIIIRNDKPCGYAADCKELLYDREGKVPKAVLWFLDSNNLCENQELSKYDYVHDDQIEWFEAESAKLKEINGGKPMPAYIFQHMPVPEEYKLLQKAKWYQLPISVPGNYSLSGNRYVGRKDTKGYVGEGPCSPDFNNGQFESWKKTGGVKAAFFGHDHLNDFSGFVDGIFLAQHKTAGFRAYTDGCKCCVRYVEIHEDTSDEFWEKLKHFKEFGLECECLGPFMKRLSDRQSIGLHHTFRALGIAAGAAALGFGIPKTIKFIKTNRGK